jgi:hypothetical protein
MGTIPSSLELHVHSVDGHVARFRQNDAAAVLTLLDHIQPGRIFSQRHLMIVGGGSLNVFPSAAVARVDLVMNGFPDWQFHWGITDVLEITEAEFQQRYHPEDEGQGQPPPGAPVVAYGEMELVNGARIFAEVHTHVEVRLPVEQGLFVQQILTAPSLYGRRRGGGAFLINPAHIVRLAFYPGPSTTPPNALAAEPL